MIFRPNLNSLVTRVTLLMMLILALAALGRIFVLTDFLRQDVTQLSSAQLLSIANYVAKDIDDNIVGRRELLKHVAATLPLPLLQDRNALQSWLATRHKINPLFSLGIFVLDTSGIVLTDYPVLPGRVGGAYADRDYFQQALKGEFTIGRPVIGRAAKEPVLPMAMPLLDKKGKVYAILVGITALRAPNFLKAMYATKVGSSGGLALISPRERLFIGASDKDIALNPVPQEGVHPLYDRAMKGWRGVGIDSMSGVEELDAIASVPSGGWFVLARMPTSEVFLPIINVQNYVIDNSKIFFPVFLIVLVMGLRFILRPLMDAAKHADQMTLGEIMYAPLPVVRNDEVGHLTQAFNRLLSKLLESRVELQHVAHHDTLTGLPNRQLLADRMQQALARAQRNQGKIAVLFFDLDGFKPINDEFGHEAGDVALCEVAGRLSKVMRSEDTLARIGGDEFVVLLSDMDEGVKEAAELVAKKCLEEFQQPFVIRDQMRKLGTSVGIAIGDGSCQAEKLLIAADLAMYSAKEAGRGQFSWANDCTLCSAGGKESSCLVRK